MSESVKSYIDPFEITSPDTGTELSALVASVRFAQKFALLFARCNQHAQRIRLISSLRSQLPQSNIQEIHFSEPITHLLDELRMRFANPSPDALFVSGLEYSLPIISNSKDTPFIANLNASRNSFPRYILCPLVLWVPEYVLLAIMMGAPDFFSVRSGVYYFKSKYSSRKINVPPVQEDVARRVVQMLNLLNTSDNKNERSNIASELVALLSNIYHRELRIMAGYRGIHIPQNDIEDIIDQAVFTLFDSHTIPSISDLTRYTQNILSEVLLKYEKTYAREVSISNLNKNDESALDATSLWAYISSDIESQTAQPTQSRHIFDIQRLIDEMPKNLKVAVLLTLDGYTLKEIAETLDVSESKARLYLNDAKNYIRKNT